jgi:uncharacterized integral membrane protein (TIGR00697 family)
MKVADKIYTGLCVFFSVIIVIGNLTYQKFVTLPIPFFHTFYLSVGAILYPLTYLVSDLIAEFYGRNKAIFCIRFALLMNIIAALIIYCMEHLEATSWSRIDDYMFHAVFGMYSIAFIGSIIACFISQNIDIYLYLFLRKLTKDKSLWLRNIMSTSVSLFIDTFIVIGFMTYFEILPQKHMWDLIYNSYSFKLFFSICSTPLFYLCVYIIGKLISKENK